MITLKDNDMNGIHDLVFLISKLERGYVRIINRAFQEEGYDLSREQYELLQVLWEEDYINQQTISRSLEKDKYNVTKLINNLENAGYVSRKTGEEDRRNNFIVLTEKGREAEKPLTRIVNDIHAELTFMIPLEQIKSLCSSLRKLEERINNNIKN